MKTPEMIVGTVEMVSPAWIMQNATNSVDGFRDGDSVNYEKMIDTKANDYGFGNLVATILSEGFRIPIVLDLSYSGEGTITHGNGHHRMAAALLLCLDEIPVYWAEGDYMSSHISSPEGSDSKPKPVKGWWEGYDFMRD